MKHYDIIRYLQRLDNEIKDIKRNIGMIAEKVNAEAEYTHKKIDIVGYVTYNGIRRRFYDKDIEGIPRTKDGHYVIYGAKYKPEEIQWKD